MWLRTSQSIPNDPQLRPAKEKHGAGREKSRGGEAEASQLSYETCVTTADDKHEIEREHVHTPERQIYHKVA